MHVSTLSLEKINLKAVCIKGSASACQENFADDGSESKSDCDGLMLQDVGVTSANFKVGGNAPF